MLQHPMFVIRLLLLRRGHSKYPHRIVKCGTAYRASVVQIMEAGLLALDA